MNCKDCIHYKVCKVIDMAGIWEKAELCESFKDAGAIIELPCKVGDTVYGIMRGKVVPLKIGAFVRGECKLLAEARDENGYILYLENDGYVEWYLTHEDAEKALEAEMK